MLHIDCICVGKLKEDYLKNAILEYSKRLSKYCIFNIVELQDEKVPSNLSEAEKLKIIEKESNNILANIKENSYVIALDLNGKQYTSEEFSEKIHRDVGNLPVLNSFDFICLYGDKVKFTLEEIQDNIQLKEKVYYFDTLKSLQEFLEKTIQKEDVILLKASNGMHLKEIVENLKRYSF